MYQVHTSLYCSSWSWEISCSCLCTWYIQICTALIAVQIWMYQVQRQEQEISQDSDPHYKEVCTATEQYKAVPYDRWVRTIAALCQLSTYLFVHNVSKLLQVCTRMYWCCTWYVLGTYKYVLGKAKKWMRIMLGFEPWTSCIASCALYCYAKSIHSMVISLVNSRYTISKIYTGVARYLLAGVGRQARVQQRPRLLSWRHWSGPRLEFPEYPFWLRNRASNVQCGDGLLPYWETGQGWSAGRFHCTWQCWHTQNMSVFEWRTHTMLCRLRQARGCTKTKINQIGRPSVSHSVQIGN